MARSTPEFRKPHHRLVAHTLNAFNAKFLSEASCFFGGGTHLAMTFGEYRESRTSTFFVPADPGSNSCGKR